MQALRFGQRARGLPVAVLAAIGLFVVAVPVQADEATTAAAARVSQARRAPTSFEPSTSNGAVAPARSGSAGTGFLYFGGTQPGMNVGGRLNVGKSHVYVPYYGTISGDPAHPIVQGTAGIAYGFRTWDISLFNGGFGNTQPTLPGVEAPKANPALSLSIRF